MEILNIIRSVPWEAKIGDPTWFGWATVAAYLLASLLCALCAWRAERIFSAQQLAGHRLVWSALAMAFLFLGFNKQLDLQSWFTAVGKAIAFHQGWYAMGQAVQVWFVIGIGAISLLLLATIGWRMRHAWRQYWVLLFGLMFLARFVIVRAASFYGVPLPQLSQFTGGFRVNWLLEIAGATLVAIAAWNNLRLSVKQAA